MNGDDGAGGAGAGTDPLAKLIVLKEGYLNFKCNSLDKHCAKKGSALIPPSVTFLVIRQEGEHNVDGHPIFLLLGRLEHIVGCPGPVLQEGVEQLQL